MRLIKCFGKSCLKFGFGLHLNWAMPTFLSPSVVYLQHSSNSHAITKLELPSFVALKILQICTFVIFEDIENGATHCIFVGFTIHVFSWQWGVSTCCMYTIDAGKEVDRPSLNANWASIRGKISQITLWAFDLRLGRGVSQNFQHWSVSLRLTTYH